MEFYFDFNKKTMNKKKVISKALGKFLDDNLKQKEKTSLNRIIKGLKLQYQEANCLITAILEAIVPQGIIEEEENSQGETQTSSQETLTQKDPPQGPSSQELTPTQNETEKSQEYQVEKEQSEPVRTDFKNVCRFYKNGTCKFGKKCKNEHPEICKKI